MTSIIRETGTQMRRLLPIALGSGLVSVLVGLVGAIAVAVGRAPDAVAELAVIYIPVMILPFAAASVVVLPIISLARIVAGARRRWLLPGIGIALAPVQVLFLLAAGRVLFRGNPHMRPTFAADVAAVFVQRVDSGVILLALATGGLVLGMLAARSGSVNRAQFAH